MLALRSDNGAVQSETSGAVEPALDMLLTPEGRALVASMTPYDPASAMARLEAARAEPLWVDHPEVVAAAATQARLRTRAAARFPGPPRWWTPAGLEQATRPVVAARHADRFVEAGVTQVADLGCGVGSDAVAMAAAGLQVLAVDRDPAALRALAATAVDLGLLVTTRHGDVRTLAGPWNEPQRSDAHEGFGCFVDPARRTDAGRTRAPETWSPAWSWVRSLAERVPATGAKVAPGIDHAAVPTEAQVEWISVGGDLVEAGVWWGPLRRGSAHRQATVLARDDTFGAIPGSSLVTVLDDTRGIPEPRIGPVRGWLVEPDPAVIRAGLVSVLADRITGHLVDPRIAYIVADTRPDPGPLGTTFRVVDQVPFARKALRAELRARGYADVVVKKRGINVVPEQLRASLHLRGAGPTATLVLTRTDAGPLALLVERADPPSEAGRTELPVDRRAEESGGEPGPLA